MSLKNLPIGIKIGGMVAVLLLLVILTSFQGYQASKMIMNEANSLEKLMEIDANMLSKEIDHLTWAGGVSNFLLDQSQTVLKIQTDGTKCKLGKWLGDENGAKKAENLVPELKSILDKIKPEHAKLHSFAQSMQQKLTEYRGSRNDSQSHLTEIYQTQIAPTLATLRGSLHEISAILATQVTEKELLLNKVASSSNRNILIISAITFLIGISISFFVSRSLTGQIKQAVSFASELSSGDFSTHLDINQNDEVGMLANSLNNIVKNLRNMVIEIQNSSEALSSASITLAAVSEQMTEGAEETAGRAANVASAAEQMSANMSSVAAATEEAATNVNMVASAAEEMTSTISEISENTSKTSEMAAKASTRASRTSARVDELGRSAQEISKVTETITEISEQTNLLALNATIEAARAGEAGKGFAVVANEIKELAKQTAEATLEIKNNIDGVQEATTNTVNEINEVNTIINDVNEMSGTVASAVEEQSATTQEIASNVSQASNGIQEVTGNVSQVATVTQEISSEIGDVNNAANEVKISSNQVRDNAKELNDLSSNLEKLISKFKV